MKILKSKIIASVILLVTSIAQPIYAGDHSSCLITKIGVYPNLNDPAISRSGYPIFLSCEGGIETMYFINSDMGKDGLAIALVAFSLKKPLWARITSDAPGGLVTVMYLSE
jgi:hypothetical protein